ncbi:MAG: DNA adenine methylase [Acholeplasmataceae bacterium]|mgnify:CR=1 FL=1|nr:DNA adenine methylase [Acholeplasmataceae bacterium]
MAFKIYNRRYTGSKNKLVPWIKEVVEEHCSDATSFCDIFAGTGVVTYAMLENYDDFIINDFLYSNEVIYNAFLSNKKYDRDKVLKIAQKYKSLEANLLEPDFVTDNYGNKYFSIQDSLKIDYIRNDIEKRKNNLNKREYNILLTSLIYSFDRIANTVGHYDAYIKSGKINDSFKFELIEPAIEVDSKKNVHIYREDANILAKKVLSDIVYIDPPYSSRQYSRFYHVIETITKWDKPELFGTALKPEPDNISEYSKTKALDFFTDLILDLKSKYIVVSYNNTYMSKSKSSKNKMSLEDIEKVLKTKGETTMYVKKHKAFNAGKTDFDDKHQEILFVTKVRGN